MKTIKKIIAIVIKDNGFFMVKKVGKDIWTSLGGKPEYGETEQETLIREIREEVGCDTEIIKKLGDFENKAVFDDAIVRLSAYHVNLIGEINLQDPELGECGFITKDYKEKGIKLPPSIEKQIIPYCIKENLLDW
ncbi:MAG: NUDIX domain-containing protein [archaeon]